MKYVGIDAGKHGAIAKIDDAHAVLAMCDCPLDAHGEIDRFGILKMVGELIGREQDMCRVVIERVRAMPYAGKVAYVPGKRRACQGTEAAFELGRSYEDWMMALAAYGVAPLEVPPQSWQSMMIGRELMRLQKGKAPSATVACNRFPSARPLLYGPRGGIIDGRADALLIAAYGAATLKSGHRSMSANPSA